jgi:hypothetical protein
MLIVYGHLSEKHLTSQITNFRPLFWEAVSFTGCLITINDGAYCSQFPTRRYIGLQVQAYDLLQRYNWLVLVPISEHQPLR